MNATQIKTKMIEKAGSLDTETLVNVIKGLDSNESVSRICRAACLESYQARCGTEALDALLEDLGL